MVRSKKGQINSAIVSVAVIIGIIILMAVLSTSNVINIPSVNDVANDAANTISFRDIDNFQYFGFLDYIFGKIPATLQNFTDNGTSQAIILIAIWLIVFFIFSDIFNMFGSFSQEWIPWAIGALLTILVSNVNGVAFVLVYSLSIMAVFGSFAIIGSLALVFILFILFHFGSQPIRQWILERKQEDKMLRARSGAEEAAEGLNVLRTVTRSAGG